VLSHSFYVLCQQIWCVCQALQLKVSKIRSFALFLWSTVAVDEEEDEGDEMDLESPPPKLQNFQEAVYTGPWRCSAVPRRQKLHRSSFENWFSNRHYNCLETKSSMLHVIAAHCHSWWTLSELSVIITNPHCFIELIMIYICRQ